MRGARRRILPARGTRGAKAKDLVDWVEASKIINKGDHLTTEGSSKIMSIKAGMNTGRSLE